MLVTNLPEVEELPWGQQLKAAWTAEGRVEGRINELREQVVQCDELHASGDLKDAAHARLQSLLTQQLEEREAELLRLQKRPPRNSE